jgi:3-phosphoshikimate 1-carboxyvinyltransferase
MEAHDHIRKPATAHASPSLNGTAHVPGDKSISHRSLMLASQAIGTTEIHGILEGEDVHSTANALRLMGVPIKRFGSGHWQVSGVGVGGLGEPENILDMGNSGTSTRLLMGLVTPYGFNSFFTGDASLRRRPMGRIITPLEQMGARILSRSSGGKTGLLPLLLQGASMPLPIRYSLPVASAQVKSGILLAALNTPGITEITEPTPTRDHTERMLRFFGADIDVNQQKTGTIITLEGQQSLTAPAEPLRIPSDPSSAAFPVVAALITGHSHITVPNVGMNAHRTGLFETLKEMGADIEWKNAREMCGEPVADLTVHSSCLKAVTVPASRAPSMIDEYPVLAVAAACAEGTSTFLGLSELTVKESNRLEAVLEGLRACGVEAETGQDEHGEPWLKVTGKKDIEGGATIHARLDHRIAMAFLVMGFVTQKPVTIDDISPIDTSFPGFVSLMHQLGAEIEVEEETPIAPSIPASSAEGRGRIIQQALCIAIDGPAASGKGTLARRLASYFGLSYLDTGRLYRAVGLKLLNLNLDPSDEDEALKAARDLRDEDLLNPRLRQENVGNAASIVSASPLVRQALLEYQQNYAKRPGGAILDGRDIGTVVCPDATIKFYITASLEARARRRFQEVEGFEAEVDYETVLAELKSRDERDQKRAVAPLKPARDAIIIDTSDMEPTEVFTKVVEMIEAYLRRPQARAS